MAGERKQKVLSKTAAMATITNTEKKRYPKLPAPAKARVDPAVGSRLWLSESSSIPFAALSGDFYVRSSLHSQQRWGAKGPAKPLLASSHLQPHSCQEGPGLLLGHLKPGVFP